jgi:hypothetical protein
VGDVVAKEGPVPWERGLAMMTDAARGLIFAEKKGIVHRDIKPDNLMLTSEGAVKIGDLGLAKKASDAAGEGGQIFGTPHFIAPEQAQGKTVDNRADIYALGATFYRVLTGKTPFSGENVKEILVKQIQEEPKPIQHLVVDMPDEIAAVVAKMMKKKPDDRYRSAQGLLEDLERIRVRYHLEAHGAAASARRTKVIAAVLGLAVLGLGAVVYHFATMEPPPAPPPPPPVEKIIPGTNQTLTPEERAGIDYTTVADKYNALLRRLQGGPGATWRNEKEWLPIADEFEAMAKTHAGTAKGTRAKEEAADIRNSIEKAKSAWNDRKAKILGEWDRGLNEASESMSSGRYNDALLRLLKAKAEVLKEENKEYLPPDPSKVLAERMKSIVQAATAKVGVLTQAAADAAPKFPGTGYPAAYAALEGVRDGLKMKDSGKDEALKEAAKDLAALDAKVEGALRDSREVAENAAQEAIDADEAAFFTGYLDIRRWAPETAGAAPEESAFFGFRWDEAIAKWETLRKGLRTDWFRARVDLKIEVYRRCKRVFETIAAKVKTGELSKPAFPKAVKRGAELALDSKERDKASAEGVWVLRLPAREKQFIAFKDMTPEELYMDFLRQGDGLPCTGEEHLDLAAFLAEAGRGDLGGNESGAASGNRVPPAENKPLTGWIEAESIRYYDYWRPPEGPGTLWVGYLQRKQAGAASPELEGIRKKIDENAGRLLLDERWYTGDLAILHCSEAGAKGQVPDRLMPAAVAKEILRTLGVPGGPGLPPIGDAPPPPRDDKHEKDGEKPGGADGTVKPGGESPPSNGGEAGGKGPEDEGHGTEKPK